MKLRFILNPRSGHNQRRPWLAAHLESFIATRRLAASVVITTRPGHATELARAALADGCDRVVAVGGDGTMNEVAQALLNSRVALGLVPCGSGNGLARHLALPVSLDAALELAGSSAASMMSIDTGVANGHPFFNAMGSGFDAEISARFNQLTRRGLPAYARIGWHAFRARQVQRLEIRTAGRGWELDTLLVAVANSDQYGNQALIAPGASVQDGKLDLVAIAPTSFLSALPLVARLFTRRLLRSPKVTHLRAAQFTLIRQAPGLIHTDGETHHTAARVEISVRPRSLRVLVPTRAPGPVPVVEPARSSAREISAAYTAFSL